MTKKNGRPFPAVEVFLAGLALIAGRSPALAAVKSDSVVHATAVAGKPDADGKQVVTLTLTIDSPWHIYANPVGLDDLAPVQTVVKASAKAPLGDVKVDYPPGKEVKDVLGQYGIYEDKAVITVTVTRAKGDDSPVELTVKVQACDTASCLRAAEIKVTAP
jgi:uncharacterized protein